MKAKPKPEGGKTRIKKQNPGDVGKKKSKVASTPGELEGQDQEGMK